jgi:hypothetical protein
MHNKMSKSVKERYGVTIEHNAYVPGDYGIIICLLICVFYIPMELVCKTMIKPYEQDFLMKMQGWRDSHSGAMQTFFSVPRYMLDDRTFLSFLMCLNSFSDSLLAFKTLLLTCVGYFLLCFFKMIFMDSRPFWDVALINSGEFCKFGYGAPQYEGFFTVFTIPYLYVLHRNKYIKNPSYIINCILIFVMVFFVFANIFSSVYNGINYIYQIIFGCLAGLVFLIMSLVFDAEIHTYCEKTAFILKSSRHRKFAQFFRFGIVWLAVTIIYLSMNQTWFINIFYIQNATAFNSKCAKQLQAASV